MILKEPLIHLFFSLSVFSFINKYDLDYVVINYESLIVSGEKYLNKMLDLIGLNNISDVGFRDENNKYYNVKNMIRYVGNF